MPQRDPPDLLASVCAHWSLTAGPQISPGGSASAAFPVVFADGRAAVLKLARRHFEAEHEADGLRVWDGNGAVRLLDRMRFDAATDALLLEACVPGTPLSRLPEPAQDEVLCALLRRLWITPPEGEPFRPLSSMCEAWADGVDDARAAVALGDPALVRDGVSLFRTLARDAESAVLLVTDLHAGNILAAEREPWLVIDPKPYVGDPTYDLTQHMLNCTDRALADPSGFATRLASFADVDPERLLQWLFARCVVECDAQPELAQIARLLRSGSGMD
jgi:streptomycin 6-kinase